jgi:Ni/Co efflux regulator RcnB
MNAMRHLMTAALALALLSGTSALAQPPGGQSSGPHGGSGGAHGGQGGAHGGQAGQGSQGGSHGGAGGAPGGGAGTHGGPSGPGGNTGHLSGGYQGRTHNGPGGNAGQQGGGYGGGNQGGTHGGPGGGGHPTGIHNAPSTYHPGFGAPGFRPGPGAARPNYSPQYFPRVFHPSHQYAWRGSAWRPQPNYYYRHWGYGDRLPFGWFGAQWFIGDYYFYDLPVPPYGYEWIRVGPDALLVDLATGMVVESVYGLFY